MTSDSKKDIWIRYYGSVEGTSPDFLFTIEKENGEYFDCKMIARLHSPHSPHSPHLPIIPGISYSFLKTQCRKLEPIEYVSYKLIGPSYFKDRK